jgi:uncharacterized protein YneF (UPF0154 family)
MPEVKPEVKPLDSRVKMVRVYMHPLILFAFCAFAGVSYVLAVHGSWKELAFMAAVAITCLCLSRKVITDYLEEQFGIESTNLRWVMDQNRKKISETNQKLGQAAAAYLRAFMPRLSTQIDLLDRSLVAPGLEHLAIMAKDACDKKNQFEARERASGVWYPQDHYNLDMQATEARTTFWFVFGGYSSYKQLRDIPVGKTTLGKIEKFSQAVPTTYGKA